MSLTVYTEEELSQGSEEWLARRDQIGATATRASCVAGEPLSYADSPKTWNELSGEIAFGSNFVGNADTERGHELEPIARRLFNDLKMAGSSVADFQQNYLEREFVTDNKDYLLAASLDGYVNDPQLNYSAHWLEIKCPRGVSSKTWKEADKGKIPKDYYWQMVHQALVIGMERTPIGHLFVYVEPPKGDAAFKKWMAKWKQPYRRVIFDPSSEPGLAKDVEYLQECWYRFLDGQQQPGDMTQSDAYRALEESYVEFKGLEDEAAKTKSETMDLMMNLVAATYGEEDGNIDHVRRITGDIVNRTRTYSARFNTKAFEEDHPELYSQYLRVSPGWRASVRKVSEVR